MKRKIHFLHIGKTGGSAVKSVLQAYTEKTEYQLIIHNHATSFKEVPPGDGIIFFLREPKSRFISGFYSRKRKGMPRYAIQWTALEREVFTTFDTPNELACALADRSAEHYNLATKAMHGIQHLSHYRNWYINFEYFQSRLNDVVFIGFQESLDDDFDKLKSLLRIPNKEILPDDDIGAHRNKLGLDTFLSKTAIETLDSWYFEDAKFVSICKGIIF